MYKLAPGLIHLKSVYLWWSYNDLNIPYIPLITHFVVRTSNQLTVFPDVTMLNLSLTSLVLTKNYNLDPDPATIPPLLAPLVKLTSLGLRTNAFTAFPDPAPLLPSLKYLNMAGNPWRCDCNLTWILSLPTTVSADLEEATCGSPAHLYGVSLVNVTEADLCGVTTGK